MITKNQADYGGYGRNKQKGKNKAAKNKGKWVALIKVLLTIFVRLYTNSCGQNTSY